ncbi:unnamed protein product [Heterotrigona itama]|uniref:Myotubularin phosphatase domain-containing protein n=1 Tax=Heterotrigona itama TaxID=395501 RepID=A0A6V7HLH3_9HYME|nr:unnamed protein product [Heterotrigona itama]
MSPVMPARIMIPELQQLIIYFSKNTYRAKEADSMSQDIIQKCLSLIDVDYKYSIICNTTGDLCAHYPSHLIILEKEKIDKYRDSNVIDVPPSPLCTEEDIRNKQENINKLKELMKNARFARCRSRFPLPVIMYKGRHVCRSATLSGGPEIYGRTGLDYFFASETSETTETSETSEASKTTGKTSEAGKTSEVGKTSETNTEQEVDKIDLPESDSLVSDWQLFDKVRSQDIKLLKTLNVGIIIDFMVENKKVKYGMNVSSSEKVDKLGRYSNFAIISLPYPGCEFFKGFRENDYVADNLIFDWSQAYVNAQIKVPEDTISSQLQIDWDRYQQWDLLILTQNYLKLILKYLSESSNGMLIHCISGWDRTPLFISLLRLSLWADNVIHTSLDAHQMLYYTIAYDWMLFGHDLQDRLSKGEEIFFFCFYFLKYICDEDFSIKQDFSIKRDSNSRSSDNDEMEHLIFHMDSTTEDPSISANGSDMKRTSRASRGGKDSQNGYSSSELIWTNSPSETKKFSNSDSQIEEPIFDMDPMTEEPSISASSFNSNRNSRNDKDKSPSKIILTNSPLATEEFSNKKAPSLPSSPNKEETAHKSVPRGQTSPVALVGRRQRTESTSSIDSWQIVTGTGSLHGSTTANAPLIEQLTSNSSNEPSESITDMSKTLTEHDVYSSITHSRKDKLCFLRNVFYTAYSQTGFRMKENSEPSNISQIIENITGIFSSTQTTL